VQCSSLLMASAIGLTIAMGAAQGCQVIAGIQTRTTDPLLTGCNLPGVGGTASTGNGKIRLVNLGTNSTTGAADFCIRTSGTTDWGRPIFRDGGNDGLCAGGLKYEQSTVPFSVPVGKIDAKAIPVGQTCAANGTSQLNGIAIGEVSPVTVVRWGNATNEALSALPEEPTRTQGVSSEYRVVNALATAKSINVGLAASAFVPTTLGSIGYGQPISPGGVEPASTGPLGSVDARGYLTIVSEAFKFGVSLASDPTNNAITVFDTSGTDTATMYVAGDPADNTHPVQGLYCEDLVSLGAAINAGEDAGTSPGGVALTAQDEALLAHCTPTQLPLISVDTFNVGLYGGDSPFPQARAPSIYAAIAQRTSDVLCVVEADEQSDRTSIAEGALSWYLYSYSVPTDLDSTPTLAADIFPPPTIAPCDPSVIPSANICNSTGYAPPCSTSSMPPSIYGCIGANCSTIPSDSALTGTVVYDGCITSSCTPSFLPIYESTLARDGCYDCIVYYFTSEIPINLGLTACTSDTRQPFSFLGQNPELILSHYPLSNEHAYILPSTGFRHVVLQATVTLENNEQFDFFCVQLSSADNDQKLPYVGNYGKDDPSKTPPENGWKDEQDKQTTELISFIEQQTQKDGLPAIVTGDFHADNTEEDGGSQSPEVITALETAPGLDGGRLLVEAVPADYTWACDYCPAPQNPYNNTTPLEFLWTFLVGFPPNSTQSNTLWGTANSVTIPPVSGTGDTTGEVAPPGNVGPLSQYYPHNVTVLRPPATQAPDGGAP
jgi:hypothetical protein